MSARRLDGPRFDVLTVSSRREHFVTFYSPGTFVSEQTTKPIPEWHPAVAVRMAAGIVERYGARPYGFQFETRLVHEAVPDGEGGTLSVEPRTVAKSGVYYLKATLETWDEIATRSDPREHILLSNMRSGDFPIVVKTTNGYAHTAPFNEADSTVDDSGQVLERGDDSRHVAYRLEKIEAWRATEQ